MFGSCATLVQAKSTRLKGAVSTSSGVEPSTLIGSDLVRAFESLKLLCFFPMCAAGGLGGCVLLALTVRGGGGIGIFVMVLITVANMRMAKSIKVVEQNEMKVRITPILRTVAKASTQDWEYLCCCWDGSIPDFT